MNGMTLIVKTITKLVFGFIIVFALWIVLYGHITPGGGFAGGVMLGCAFILLVLAFGKKAALNIVSEKGFSALDSIGALCFLGIALLGFLSGLFFTCFVSRGTPLRIISGGTLLWSNIAIGIKVFAGILSAFITLVVFRITAEK